MEYLEHDCCALGPITLAGEGDFLTGLWFDGQKHFGAHLSKDAEYGHLPVFDRTRLWLDRYFEGIEQQSPPWLCLRGTAFQREVWQILRRIPYGRVTTYGQIAAQLAQDKGVAAMSARAVGNAVARNPISILVPCHRVVGSGGRLTGYAGGIERKARLLALEGANFR